MMRLMGYLGFSHLFLFVPALFPYIAAAASFLCHPDDQTALLKFKASFTTDPSFFIEFECDPKMNSWNKSIDCCTWNGVSCNELSGHVIGLDLSMSCIVGNIYSDSSLFSLQHIQKLNLAFNDFNLSPVCPEFGQLSSLTHLNLSTSNFTGTVPAAISGLTELVSLDLSRSDTLEMKKEILTLLIQNLSKLRVLHLSGLSLPVAKPFMNLTSSLVSLDLENCQLQGEFPESVFHLPNLERLSLRYNYDLKGSIPESFNSTSPLKMLDITLTSFSGNIPFSIGNLKSLEYLALSKTNMLETIPASIGNLTNLSFLELSGNKFSGEIPSSISHLHHLTYLSLSDNAIKGCIPASIGNMSKLESLYITNDYLVGQSSSVVACQFPLWISNLPKLTNFICRNCRLVSFPNHIDITKLSNLIEVDLSNNFLNGNIPPWLFSLPSLTMLNLRDNQLSGQVQIPSPVSNSSRASHSHSNMVPTLQNLIFLDLSNNKHLSLTTNKNLNYSLPSLRSLISSSCNITEFPNFLRGSGDLEELDLSENRIKGKLPIWMTTQFLPWGSLKVFDISSNLIEGVIPIPPPKTEVFHVSKNKFTGDIPSGICNASNLQIIDMSNNSLGGLIPLCLGNFSTRLILLNLGSNKLHGPVPKFFSVCNELKYVNLNGNLLRGSVPQSLNNCGSLEALDLGNNLIDDTFPKWLSTLPNLKVLVFHRNRFHGTLHIEKTKYSFPSLQIIDLSYNNFTGQLPLDFFTKMKARIGIDEQVSKYLGGTTKYYTFSYSAKLNIKGSTLSLEKIFIAHTIVDLSCNKFSGGIPSGTGKLVALKGLNLSHNHLQGNIPGTIGNLRELEWLDLSSNNLTGRISVRLAKNLGSLNLSCNQLQGPIPDGPPFDTFDESSYEGNSGLCGTQLSRKCMQSQESPPPHSNSSWDDIYGFSWITISIGYVCGTVFGLVVGCLVISEGRPIWLTRIVNRIQDRRGRCKRKATKKKKKQRINGRN